MGCSRIAFVNVNREMSLREMMESGKFCSLNLLTGGLRYAFSTPAEKGEKTLNDSYPNRLSNEIFSPLLHHHPRSRFAFLPSATPVKLSPVLRRRQDSAHSAAQLFVALFCH
jgi:hypothetical protein